MKSIHRFVSMIVLCCICSSIPCCNTSCISQGTPDVIPSQSPSVLYQLAVDKLTASGSFCLRVNILTCIITDSQVFKESVEQITQYTDWGTKDVQSVTQQQVNNGGYLLPCTHEFKNEHAYLDLNGAHFQTEISFDAYAKEFSLPFFPDISSYEITEIREYSNRILIGFSQPIKYESWAVPLSLEPGDASALIVLDSNGNLLEAAYSLSYAADAGVVMKKFVLVPDTTSISFSMPADPDYIMVENLSAPLLLERSCGYLNTAESIISKSVNKLICQANGLERIQTTELTMTGRGPSLDADIVIQAELTDHTRSASPVISTQSETFRNGVYMADTNGVLSENRDITAQIMSEYCQNILLNNIPLVKYFETATYSQTGTDIILRFQVSDAFANLLRADVCDTLYENPTALDAVATSYNTDAMDFILHVDALTTLPIFTDLLYSGVYTINENVYSLLSQTEQTYSFGQ